MVGVGVYFVGVVGVVVVDVEYVVYWKVCG